MEEGPILYRFTDIRSLHRRPIDDGDVLARDSSIHRGSQRARGTAGIKWRSSQYSVHDSGCNTNESRIFVLDGILR